MYMHRGTSRSKYVKRAKTAFTVSEDGSSNTRSTRSKSKNLYSATGSNAAICLELGSECARPPYQFDLRPKLKLIKTKHSSRWLKRDRGTKKPAVNAPSLLESDTNDGLHVANMNVEYCSSGVLDTMSSGSRTKSKELKTEASPCDFNSDVYRYTSDNSDSQVPYKPWQKLKDKLSATKDDNHLSRGHTEETKEPTTTTSLPSDSHLNDFGDEITAVKMESHSFSEGSDVMCKETLGENDVVPDNITPVRLDSDVSDGGFSEGTHVPYKLRPRPKQDPVMMKYHMRGHINEEEPLPKTSLPSDSDNNIMKNCDDAENIETKDSTSSMVMDTIPEDNKMKETGKLLRLRRSPRILQSTCSSSHGSTTKDGDYSKQESSKKLSDMTSKQGAPLQHDVSSRSPVKQQQNVGSKSSDQSPPSTLLRRSERAAVVASRGSSLQPFYSTRKRRRKQPPGRATKKQRNIASSTSTDITTTTQTELLDDKPCDESRVLQATRFELDDACLSTSLSNDFKSSRKRLRFNTTDSECNSNSTTDLKATVKRVRFSEPSDGELSEIDNLLMNIANGSLSTPQESQEGKTSSSVRKTERKTVNCTTGASETNDCLQLGGEVTIYSDCSASTTLQTKPGNSRKKKQRKGKKVALTPSNQLSKNTDLEVSLPPPETLPGSPPVVESEEPLASQCERPSSGIHTVLSQVSKICEGVGKSREVKKGRPKKGQQRRDLTRKKRNMQTTNSVGSLEGCESASQSQVKQKRNRRTPAKDRVESATAPPVKRNRRNPASAASTSLNTYTIPKVSQKALNKIQSVIDAVSKKQQKAPPANTQSTSPANSQGESHQQVSKGRMEPSSPHNHKMKYGGEQSSSAKQVKTSSVRLHRPSTSGKRYSSLKRDDCITTGSHEESRSNIRLEGSMQASVAVNKSKSFDTSQLEGKENQSCVSSPSVENRASSPFGSTVQAEDTADNSSLPMDEIDVVNFTPEYNDPSPDDDPVYKCLLLNSIRGESPFRACTASGSGVYVSDEMDSSPKPYLSPEIGMMNQLRPSQHNIISKSHHTSSPLVQAQPFSLVQSSLQRGCSETDRYYIINDEYEESQLHSQYSHAPVQRVARQVYSSDNESFVSGSSVGVSGSSMNRTVKLYNL